MLRQYYSAHPCERDWILSVACKQRYCHLSKSFCRILLPVLALVAGVAVAKAQEGEAQAPGAGLSGLCPEEYARFAAGPVGASQVQEYYLRQHGLPQWQDAARRAQLLFLLEELRYDGLQPAEYRGSLQQVSGAGSFSFCRDAEITHDYLLALHHLQHGRLRQAAVEPYWVEPAAGIKDALPAVDLALQAPDDLAASFLAARPSRLLYTQLREQLRAAEPMLKVDWPLVPAGPSLKPGVRDPRVAALRARLQQAGYWQDHMLEAGLATEADIYDESLVAAVKAFQGDHYLEDDGIVGPATLRELNVSPRQRMMQIRANLERLRWLEKYFEPEMLVVDIAGARLLYLEGGQVTWRTRTQVGTVARQTPLLKSRITHLTLNPTWTVPPTIFRNDKLPAIRKDVGYLERSRMQVLDSQGRVLDPGLVDWSAPGNILLRQEAGPGNALGRVAIRFANPFAVYLHDTPSQHLFGRATRTVSSGCVRVESVLRLLDLLAPDQPTQKRIEQLLDSGHTRQVTLVKPVPVMLAYLTVEVDADSRLRFRSDSYGLDQRVIKELERIMP